MADLINLQQARIQSLDEGGFYAHLAQTRGPCIVFFTRQSCSSCRAWRKLLSEYVRHEPVQVFEVDVEVNMALANEYQLFHLPALFLFIDGEFHRELQCEAQREIFHQAVLEALRGPAQEAP